MSERKPQDQDKFVLRLPNGMRDRIKFVAERNNRSMNAQIVDVLEEAFPPLITATETQLEGALRATRDALYSTELSDDQKDDLWQRMLSSIHGDGI